MTVRVIPVLAALPDAEMAVLVTHDNMSPTIPRGSIALLGPRRYCGEGVYCFGDKPHSDPDHIRRVIPTGGQFETRYDNTVRWGDGRVSGYLRCNLERDAPRLVVGIIAPLTPDFEVHLRQRFFGEGGR